MGDDDVVFVGEEAEGVLDEIQAAGLVELVDAEEVYYDGVVAVGGDVGEGVKG